MFPCDVIACHLVVCCLVSLCCFFMVSEGTTYVSFRKIRTIFALNIFFLTIKLH